MQEILSKFHMKNNVDMHCEKSQREAEMFQELSYYEGWKVAQIQEIPIVQSKFKLFVMIHGFSS